MKTTFTGLLCALVAAVAVAEEKPLLIGWGQIVPDTRLLREHAFYYESYLPFDGIVIPLNQEKFAGRYGDTGATAVPPEKWPVIRDDFAWNPGLSWTVMTPHRADAADYEHAIEDLKATKFEKFKHNFLPIYCLQAHKFNWFDDELWETTLHNVRVLARIAREGGCEGIWFDPEQYGSRCWAFGDLRKAYPDHPQELDAFATQVRKRGAEFIRTINEEFPGCQFLSIWGSSFNYFYETRGDKPDAAPAMSLGGYYGLLPAFMDGVIVGADEGTTVTDGCEMSYYYKTARHFAHGRDVVRYTCRGYSSDPELYERRIHVAFGIWPARSDVFDPNDLSKGDYTPDELAHAIRMAMNVTDRYVWIWNEAASFWIKGGPEGKPLLPKQAAGLSGEKPTLENAVDGQKYYGMPKPIIDAIARGKAQALEDFSISRRPD